MTRTEPRPEPTQDPGSPGASSLTGLGINDEFRLLFVSSTKRTSGYVPGGLNNYNDWIKDLVAAGHTDIQAYKSNFKVVGCIGSRSAPRQHRNQLHCRRQGSAHLLAQRQQGR